MKKARWLALSYIYLFFPWVFAGGNMQWIANSGQWESPVLYRASLKFGAIFATNDGLTFVVAHPEYLHHSFSQDSVFPHHGFQLKFIHTHPNTQLIPSQPIPSTFNYFLNNDPASWAVNVPGYTTLTWKNLYPGIDLIVEDQEGHVKYSLHLSPGADLSQVALVYSGIHPQLQPNGSLVSNLGFTQLTESPPKSWQIHPQKGNLPISLNYHLTNDTLRFVYEKYNSKLPLVIDPTLIFSSYTGSLADNFGFTATYDPSGCLYAGGRVYNPGYPLIGAFQTTFGGVYDVSISKFTSNGNQLVYSTYLGGSQTENPHSLVVNSQGELIVMGTTQSDNFPTSSPIQGARGGGWDMFVAKFNASGNQLLGSTFIGGTGDDAYNSGSLDYNYGDHYRGEVYCDTLDQIYVVSHTRSVDFPVTPGCAQPLPGGDQDAVVLKFSADLTSLLWATYLGGSDTDAGYGIKTTRYGNVVVTGGTRSPNFPTTTGAWQTGAAGSTDAYLTVLPPNGNQWLRSSYVGSTAYDQGYFLQLDPQENIWIYGQTEGAFPRIAGPSGNLFENINGKMFLIRFDSLLTQPNISTRFGSGRNFPDLSPTAFLVDNCGNLFCSGWAASLGASNPSDAHLSTQGLLTTPNAIKTSTNGTDFYLMVLQPEATALQYGTFLGGNQSEEHVDGGTSRFSPQGIVYHAVCGGCGGYSDFPTTPGVVSNQNLSSNCNLAAFKIDFEVKEFADFTYTASGNCPPYPVQFTYQGLPADQYRWFFGTWPPDSSSQQNPLFNYPKSGTFLIRLIANESTCVGNDTVTKLITLQTQPFAALTLTAQPCDPYVSLSYSGSSLIDSILWVTDSFPPRQGTFVAYDLPAPGTYAFTQIAYSGVCTDTLRDTFFLGSVPSGDFLAFPDTCSHTASFRVIASDSLAVRWKFGDGDNSELRNPKHTFPQIKTWPVQCLISNSECTKVIEKQVNLLVEPGYDVFIPNVFTPNQDGNFDQFKIQLQTPEKYELSIFDRWGNLVFGSFDPEQSWDGKVKGNEVIPGVYFYVLKTQSCAGDPVQHQGYISLVR